jgi:HEAT repeat protein
MGMIAEGPVDEWFSSLPKTGGIYRLINGTMGDRIRNERIGAVIALGESADPRAVRPLMDCCSDPDASIRKHATEALLKLKSGRSVYVLIGRMNDKNEEPVTRERAAAALASIRSFSAIEALRALYADADEDPALRSLVAEELHRVRIR